MSKLNDRIESYEELSELKLLNKVPVIICINGRSFSKNTSLIDKPYCEKFAESMFSTMLRLCTDVEGVVFGYQHNDEIVLVLRNDQSSETMPWYDNNVQKISSACSSIASLHFAKCSDAVGLNLMSDAIFITKAFAVPTISEAINTMIYKQQRNFHTSIQFSCFYELLNKKYDKPTIREMLSGLSTDEKIELLDQECGVDFNSYPLHFRRGAACYKVQNTAEDGRKHWVIDNDLPIFSKEQSFLSSIFNF